MNAKDQLGKEILVGDKVAYAASVGRHSCELRVGEVVKSESIHVPLTGPDGSDRSYTVEHVTIKTPAGKTIDRRGKEVAKVQQSKIRKK